MNNTNVVVSLLGAVALPLLVLPLEMVLPLPHVWEELAKWLLVKRLIVAEKELRRSQWPAVLAAGGLVTASETALYAANLAESIPRGIELAREAIASGAAYSRNAGVMLLPALLMYRRSSERVTLATSSRGARAVTHL